MKWLKDLYYWTLNFADKKYNTLALSIVSFTEASFFLIPPEVLFLPMAASRPKKSFYYAFLMSLFSVLGAFFGYWIGHSFWLMVEPFFFEYVFSPSEFHYVKDMFSENTFSTMFIAGFTPIPFKVFTVVAGVVSAPLATFFIASALSRSLRYFFLAILFYFFGPGIRSWIDRHFEKATVILTLAFIVLIVIYKSLKP